MSLDLADLRARYRALYSNYVLLTERAKHLLGQALEADHLGPEVAHVSGRAKGISNFQRKAIRKHLEDSVRHADPLTAITDKAGVRVVVDHLERRNRVLQIATEVFQLGEVEDTSKRYKANELGYLGLHVQGTIRSADLSPEEQQLRGLEFELQIHTQAQHAWSTVSHPVTYKPFGGDPPVELATKVYRLVALVSMFDEEVDRVNRMLVESPDYLPQRMLSVLDRQFAGWLPSPSDDQLSLQVLGVVAHAYTSDEMKAFDSRIDVLVREHRTTLDTVLGHYQGTDDEYPLLFQPEVLAIYERLLYAKARLRSAWIESRLPTEYLDQLAVVFASPY